MSETQETPQADVATPEIDPADDLRAALASAYDEVAGTEEAPQEEISTRDEKGRFVAQARETTGVADHETPVDETQTEALADGQQTEAAPQTRSEVPPELASVKSVLDRYQPLYAARGVAPDQALAALFEAQRALETQPQEAIRVLARQYGVDLSALAQPTQPHAPQGQNPTDPALATVLNRVQQLEQVLTTQQQQAELARQADISRMIENFAADPKHSHFPAVRQMMGGLMTSGAAQDLETAYQMACRAHPEISKAMAKADADAREKAAAEERRRAAAEAKAKAVQVRGSPPINGFNPPPEDLRSLISAAWDGRLN